MKRYYVKLQGPQANDAVSEVVLAVDRQAGCSDTMLSDQLVRGQRNFYFTSAEPLDSATCEAIKAIGGVGSLRDYRTGQPL